MRTMEKHLHHHDRSCVQTFSIIIVLSFCARALNVLSLLGLSLFSPFVRHSPPISTCTLSVSLPFLSSSLKLPSCFSSIHDSYQIQKPLVKSTRLDYSLHWKKLKKKRKKQCIERKSRKSICLIYPSHAKQIRKIRFSSSCIFYMGLISVLIFAIRNTLEERMKKSN